MKPKIDSIDNSMPLIHDMADPIFDSVVNELIHEPTHNVIHLCYPGTCSICWEETEIPKPHVFIDIKDACKCEPDAWFQPPRKICDKFEAEPLGMCMHCEHDEACHDAVLPVPIADALAYMGWLQDRLIFVYNENPNADFVLALKRHTETIRAYLDQVKK